MLCVSMAMSWLQTCAMVLFGTLVYNGLDVVRSWVAFNELEGSELEEMFLAECTRREEEERGSDNQSTEEVGSNGSTLEWRRRRRRQGGRRRRVQVPFALDDPPAAAGGVS